MRLSELPRPLVVYGFAGLLPFAAGALGVWLLPLGWSDLALTLEMAYGAVTLSFLGALHWGLALAGIGTGGDSRAAMTWTRLGWPLLPALVGWASLFVEPSAGLVLQLLAFAGLFHGEVKAVGLGLLPLWYLRLRRPLTAGAVLALGLSLLCLLILG